MKTFIHRWMIPRVGGRAKYFRGGQLEYVEYTSISSICVGSILRVLAVFPGSIYSGYSGYCKVCFSNVCTAGAACVLGVLYTAYHVVSTRSIWAFSTADTPSTRRINFGHHSNRVPQYSRYQQYPEYRNETYITSSMYMCREQGRVPHRVGTRKSPPQDRDKEESATG